jgi:ribonucleoside-triphosphate reductase
MSVPHRVRGVRILKAVSSPHRLQILNLLFDRGALSYTELMSLMKMNPTRDAGRFAYHLKSLLKAELIEADVETKKYYLTDMGKMVIDVADRIEKKADKPKSILVRTSHFALEEFDANKIANSLIKEAKMPAEQAQKVAKEAEKWLVQSKTKYLTAPLVREVVNAILIEKGLEEHRHKLTRLGLPVYDVTALISAKNRISERQSGIAELAGEAVLNEYILLNVLSRDIADAHLSGSIHIKSLNSWILKPSEIMHDLRFFFQNGINMEKIDATLPSHPPPESLEYALSLVLNVLLHSSKEISETQTIDYFNVFLAPFAKNVEPSRIKEALRLFIANVNQHTNASLGLELTIPDFVADKPAIGPSGTQISKYADFSEEAQLLASFILEIIAEESAKKPLLNPKIILKTRQDTFTNEKAKLILQKAHQLAAEKGILYFASLLEKDQECSVFSGSGIALRADLSGDWETDTMRTGCLGHVTLNLPRTVIESGRDKTKFFEILRERFDVATRALEIKDRWLKQHSKDLLPFLMQTINGDHYFRLENCSRTINLAGLKETVEAFNEKDAQETEKAIQFMEEISDYVQTIVRKTGRRSGRRLSLTVQPDLEAAHRLAHSDIERYGIAKVRFSGTREKPFYSTVNRLILKDSQISLDSLAFAGKMRRIISGGALMMVELGEMEHKTDELMSVTKQLFETHDVDFLTYDREMTYCTNCRRSWFGLLHKCPSCGSMSTLVMFDQFAST